MDFACLSKPSSSRAIGARRGLSAMQGTVVPMARALPSYVLNCPETQVTTLPNGLRVASEVSIVCC